jgi:hypothetical protein
MRQIPVNTPSLELAAFAGVRFVLTQNWDLGQKLPTLLVVCQPDERMMSDSARLRRLFATIYDD